jgi:hypothetical protein
VAGTGQNIPDIDRRGPDFNHPTPTQEHLDQRWKDLPAVGPATAISEPIDQTPASTANYTVTRLGYKIAGVIIHTTVGSEASAVSAFQSPARGASAHYIIACDGSHVDQCVPEVDIAWQCGRFYTDGSDPLANCNTIGIEHCDNGNYNSPRPDGLYITSSDLVRDICKRYGIPIDRAHIRKHLEVSVAATSCCDSLDINRIVAMAAGAPPPPPLSQEDDMLYTGAFHTLTATLKQFAPGSIYSDPSTAALGVGAMGASVAVTGFIFANSGVQSADRGAGAGPGIDYVWWKLSDGHWVSDALLNTVGVAGAPIGVALSALPVGMTLYFAKESELASVGGVTMVQVTGAITAALAKLPATGLTKDQVDAEILTALGNFKPVPGGPHHHSVLGIINTGPVITD